MALFLLNFINKNLNCCWTPEKLIPNYYHHSYCSPNTSFLLQVQHSLHVCLHFSFPPHPLHCAHYHQYWPLVLKKQKAYSHIIIPVIFTHVAASAWRTYFCFCSSRGDINQLPMFIYYKTESQDFTTDFHKHNMFSLTNKALSFLYLNYRVNRPVCLLSCSLRVHTFFSPSLYKMIIDEKWLKLHILSMPVWSFSATDLELILFFCHLCSGAVLSGPHINKNSL